MNIRTIIGIILVVLVIIFGLQNITVVDIRFLFWKFEMSRAFMVFIIFIVGFVSGWLFKTFKW